ncbi:PLP-dependent aminotransferase family protein [Undibacterium sp.]|jgi:DNA-binding transcriptional MocR family regulator|uniref:aminotransferase-like domain-containing protein n=1 Tax=Undibacterium sp. TaxID=1914977 RepID=UPI002BC23F73|nr:PLP-dependent aminotransferase family protein [Undibacterium sp.]HTD02895.1 PLP-dependent aminotransferase family protein [Undibacterium sp.]
MDKQTLYRKLAAHYIAAIKAGTLASGDRMPSVRKLMQLHGVSLSTALTVCRHMEAEGWLEARPRSGYFVRQPKRVALVPLAEPKAGQALDPAQFVGIHERVSAIISQGQRPVKVNLARATGAPELYPEQELKILALRALRQRPDILTKACPPRGNQAFKSTLAKRAMAYGLTIAADDIVVTHGCIEALNLALRAVAQAGDVIAVESPTFYGLLQVLESLGMKALEIPTSPQTGISLEALELAMQTYPNIKAVVVVPHLQNPLGSIMPDAHKEKLVQLCETHGIPLIEDDSYSALANSDAPLLAAKSWDRTGNVIYCASLHKILAPGLRLGWMVAGRWHARVNMLKYAQTRYNEEWAQIIVAEFMGSSSYDRHLRRLRGALKTQRERTAEAIAAYFPPGTRLTIPDGGVSLWVELPQQLSSQAVFDAALQQDILVSPGLMFSNSNRFDHFLRINCGLPYSADLDQALRKLGQIVALLIERKAKRPSIAA